MTPRAPVYGHRSGAIAAAALAVAILLVPAAPHAALTRAEIEAVGVTQRIGVAIPGVLRFRDTRGDEATLATRMRGRPTVFVFADYQCQMVCGAALRAFQGILAEMPPGAGAFNTLVVGLDTRDTPTIAQQAKTRYFGARPPPPTPTFLVGGDAAVRQLARTVGYHYAYDAERDEFAHPVVAIVADESGRVVRYLSVLGMSGRDLALALNEAGAPPNSLAQAIRMLCYRYDPATGLYTTAVEDILQVTGALTVAAMIAGFIVLMRRARKRAHEEEGARRRARADGRAPRHG